MKPTLGAKVSSEFSAAFCEAARGAGLTKSEAIRQALHLFVDNEAPRAVNRPSKGCERDRGGSE